MELNLSGLNLSLYYLQQDTENYVLASLILCWPKFFGNCRRASYSRISTYSNLGLVKFSRILYFKFQMNSKLLCSYCKSIQIEPITCVENAKNH